MLLLMLLLLLLRVPRCGFGLVGVVAYALPPHAHLSVPCDQFMIDGGRERMKIEGWV